MMEKCFICSEREGSKEYDLGNGKPVLLCLLCYKAQLDGKKDGGSWKKKILPKI